MSKLFIINISIVLSLYLFQYLYSSTIVFESFNDRQYGYPLVIFNKDSTGSGDGYNLIYVVGRGDVGFCLQGNHAESGMSVTAMIGNLEMMLDEGIYIRYWVKYSNNYSFPADEGDFDNLKMLKFAGTGEYGYPDLEFIYKNTGGGGPSNLQLVWDTQSGNPGGTGVGDISLKQAMNKDIWHKIEIYMEVPNTGNSFLHVQVNDIDVYQTDNADIKSPASLYTGTKQFASIRASNLPPAGSGLWYIDDITILHDEGDRCNSEPPEPSNGEILPPRKPAGVKVTR